MSCFLLRQIWNVERNDSIGQARIVGRKNESQDLEHYKKNIPGRFFIREPVARSFNGNVLNVLMICRDVTRDVTISCLVFQIMAYPNIVLFE
jgi:hypothetical protein